MIRTAKMVQLTAVIPDRFFQPVTSVLLELGQLDFISTKEFSSLFFSSLKKVNSTISLSKLKEYRKKLESILAVGNLVPPALQEPPKEEILKTVEATDFDTITDEIDGITAEIDRLRQEQRLLQKDFLRVEEMLKQLQLALKAKGKGSHENIYATFLVVRHGELKIDPSVLLLQLREFSSVLTTLGKSGENSSRYALVHLKKDMLKVESFLNPAIWQNEEIFLGDSALDDLLINSITKQLNEIKEARDQYQKELEEKILEKKESLFEIWKRLRICETYFAIQERFSKTERTFIFSGWIAAKVKGKVSEGILKACDGECFIEFLSAAEAKNEAGITPPVKLETPRFLKPFEKVITDFSVPAYGTLNPAYIVSITFMLMFGLMFGDAGHGAVLLLTGIFGSIFTRKKEQPHVLFRLLIWCGTAAVFFGVLFGSYFGYSWFPALWFNYHGAVVGEHAKGPIQNIMQVLALTAWLGVGVISLGILFNFYNCASRKKWIDLIADKNGIAGAFLYWMGVFWVYSYLKKGAFPSLLWWGSLLSLGCPLLLFGIRLVLHSIHEKGRFQWSSLPLLLMELLIELLEVFSGYLANTLSFLRVAGLGIAHVSLMSVFFSLAQMIGQDTIGRMIGYWILILLGNILVIALEGLSAWIQTLRLHYYEFFNRFLVGGGVVYRPISLSNQWDE